MVYYVYQIENKELRDLLSISKSSIKAQREEEGQPEPQASLCDQ